MIYNRDLQGTSSDDVRRGYGSFFFEDGEDMESKTGMAWCSSHIFKAAFPAKPEK